MWIHVTTRTSTRYLHFWGVLSLMMMLRTNSAQAQSAVYYSDISDDGVNVYAWAVTDAYMGTSIYHHSVQTAGAMQSEVNFEYDADGNLIGRESFIAGISRGKSHYTYNAQGDMITA